MDACTTTTPHRCMHHHGSNESQCVELHLKCQLDLVVTSAVMKRNAEHTKIPSWFIDTKDYLLLHLLVVIEKRERLVSCFS